MVFNSATFVIFFLAVIAVYNLPLSRRARKAWLLLASYVFYAAWNPPFVALLWISTLTDWIVAGRMGKTGSPRGRKLLLAASLLVNIGLLAFFKYGNFMLDNFIAVAAAAGIRFAPARLDIILPIGISFYTFQTLSYTFDVYRGRIGASRSLLDYSLYVTFFPQLVSGPIVRADEFLPQCETPRRATANMFMWGACLFVFGLFLKEFLADYMMAPVAEKVFSAAADAGFADAWLGALAFSGQIFFDFSGYSTCAVGAALCLGFSLPANFRYPYGAAGFSDFWRRWHITLSSWFRDYMYIPLGGSRRGVPRYVFAVLFTMLACGLWHGASWGFVVWGGVHGVFLIVDRAARRALQAKSTLRGSLPVKFFAALATFALVTAAWVFFRADSLHAAAAILYSMVSPGRVSLILNNTDMIKTLVVCGGLFASHWTLRNSSIEKIIEKTPWWIIGLIISVMLVLIAVAPGDDRAFIYFQF